MRNDLGITRTLTCLLAVLAVVTGTGAPAGAAMATTVLAAVPVESTMPAAAPVDAVAPVSASADGTARAAADPVAAGIAKATLAGFNAGNIISDAVFTNKDTMTEAQIQAFFNSQVSRCRGGMDEKDRPIVCLKDFRIDSVTRPADAYCSGYTGARNESAARIIYRVAQSCNINPQVLIVMLQKEQGLVTHTWPSAWRYNIALGHGCPDTAPCDPRLIGFFHQIYGAARQMQIYMEGRSFKWYAPSKTWNILYNPNRSCGSSPVYIANRATSALYYYTPYQPNAAALRAGYGVGDACSAYGNRNFYNYFTDWFGSTQTVKHPEGPIVNVGPDIYAITNGTAYHITPSVWPEYRAAFGNPEPAAAAHIASLRQGGRATLFLHDEGTGTVAYLNGGKTHRFSTCDLVGKWRGNCSTQLTRFDSDDFRKPSAGSQMTLRANVAGDGRLFVIEGTNLVPYSSAEAVRAWGQDPAPFAATMLPPVAATYRALPTRFVPGQLISPAGSPRVYLPSAGGVLYYLPSFDLASSIGISRTVSMNVAPSALSQYRKAGNLGRYLSCGDRTYFAAGGGLYRVQSSEGFGAASFDARTCGRLKVSNDFAGPLFVRGVGESAVYVALDGVFRHVGNPATLAAVNGPGNARVVSLTSAEISALPKGAQLRADIGFVVTPGDGRVYLSDAGRLIYLNSWARADDLGLPRSTVTISDAAGAAMPKAGMVSTVVFCNGRLYSASAGTLTEIPESPDIAPMQLSVANCTTLRLP